MSIKLWPIDQNAAAPVACSSEGSPKNRVVHVAPITHHRPSAISGLGIGIESLWQAALEGRTGIAPITMFDASRFDSRIAAEVSDVQVRNHVPKHYRKAIKVMCRDIELAVVAADLAARDAALVTPGTDEAAERSYSGSRTGAQIGAGLISSDLEELTAALFHSADEDRKFDIHRWGNGGMEQLTPLWLLKYLPNMLACHVTIIHDTQGPSNTITCCESSAGLSLAESKRVIERGAADACFCGGAESKLHAMTFYRQMMTGRLTTSHNDDPAGAIRPFDTQADGTVAGEGAGILIAEAAETARARGARVYAELAGAGAGHDVKMEREGLEPESSGRGIAVAIKAALRDAGIGPDAIDVILPFGSGIPASDRAEANAYRTVFGDRLPAIPVWSSKPLVGVSGAGTGGLDAALACKIIAEQTIPPRLNTTQPLEGMQGATAAPATTASLKHALVVSAGMGGQNVALIFKKV